MNKPSYILLFSFILILTLLTSCRAAPTATSSPQIETPPTQEAAPSLPEGPEPTETKAVAALENQEVSPDAVQALVAELEGLSLGEFFETSFRALVMRSPERVLIEGLTDAWGVTEARLDDISDEYQRETYAMKAAVLALLQDYDRAALSPEEQISYDVYRWHLEDELAGLDFIYHDYPATYYPITAVHEDLLLFFSDLHPVSDLHSARDYVTRLGQVSTKIDQLIEGLELREAAGITPPQYAIQWAVYGGLGSFVESPARQTQLYTSFKEKTAPLSSITPEDQAALLDQAEGIIADQVLPAYRELHAYLSRMQTYAGEDSGVWRLPLGRMYYDYRLHHYTTTDLSADQIHQLGLDELGRIHAEMRAVFDQLGYPPEETIVQAYDRAGREGGRVSASMVPATYEELIAEAEGNLDSAFDIKPEADVIVVSDQGGDFYIRGSLDGSRPGAFYASGSGSGKDYYAMPTLAYHETVPGHHLQIAIAQELEELPSLRQGLSFTAYTEGWALYAEQLAWELGWYHNDPYGYLGLLQSQAFRAARLVVDTGLHAKGWTFEQAQDFFTENTGFEVGDNVNPQHQIARYLVWPGQSVAYYVGYLKIMELRAQAMEQLGEGFDLKEFHRVVLTNGSIPLEILEEVVAQYIAEKMSS